MIVVDTSVAIAALTGRHSARDALVDQRLVAPAHIDAEVAHVLRGLVLGRKLGESQASAMLAVWGRLSVDRVPQPPLLARIWELRSNLTAYDAAFVAAAESQGIPLVTSDRRLANAVGPRCVMHLIPE